MPNMFDNHNLVHDIYNCLRDANVLKSAEPLNALTTDERRFLVEIDKLITEKIEHDAAVYEHEMGDF